MFLTTIHKFTEDVELLTNRSNVICISDEAHRSQVNLDQKVTVTEEGVKRTYGFAKYLHDSLPNATYVGFTGTPIDATLDVFGPVVDSYTMKESVVDEITVPIVYEGRAAKVLLDNSKLKEIEAYYAQCADDGASNYAIDASKKANVQMNSILGDPGRLKSLAADFVQHYEARIEEGSTVAGKAMFVSSNRTIAYAFYKEVIALRPQWGEVKVCADGATATKSTKTSSSKPRISKSTRSDKLILTSAGSMDISVMQIIAIAGGFGVLARESSARRVSAYDRQHNVLAEALLSTANFPLRRTSALPHRQAIEIKPSIRMKLIS